MTKVPRFGFFKKKPWEKCMCSFELQEYGGDGGKGWHSITEATGAPISQQESGEFFKPDRHYRVIARALEGEQSGRFIGVVWDHYEPHRGLLKKEDEEKREKAPPKPKEVEDVIGEWADKVDQVLAPVEKIMDTMDRIRGRFGGGEAAPKGEGEEGASYQIPPPEFDGKLPAIMHPYVVHVIAEEIKGVIDYGATRIGEAFGVGGLPGQPSPKEEEEEAEVIPSLAKFKEKKKAAELPPEKEAEGEEEELPAIPMPKKKPKPAEEAPIGGEEEVVPSLVEKEPITESMQPRRCVNCGRTEAEANVKILPNGLCEECASKLAKEEEEELPSMPKKRRRKRE